MNWEAIGAIGESLSAIAVLVTLGYLAVQIRQNTRATKASASNSAMRDVSHVTENNGPYSDLVMKSLRMEKLTPAERLLMVERFLTIMRTFENFWYQQQLGNLSLDQFERQLDTLRWALNVPAARRMWVHLAPAFDSGFRAVVDSEVLEEKAPVSRMHKAFAALDPEWVDRG